MAATITGIVYNDVNRNGQYDTGEPGIPGAYIVLSGASGCTTTQTDANGNYSFSAEAGSYAIYEPVISPNGCPPTAFTQPSGFNVSNGPRKRTVNVTAAQATNGATIAGQNFSHALENDSLTCNAVMIQFAGVPTVRYDIDLVTGVSTPQGPLTPAHYVNAVGESPLDSFLYGYDQTTHNMARIDANGILTALLPNPPGLPVEDYTTGAFDANGFFYLYAVNEPRYYTIDLRPDSATFLKLVDPRNGYVEQTANYGTPLSTAIDVSDWAIDPLDGNLYGVNRSGNVDRVVPTTGAVTVLTTTGPKEPVDTSYGASAFDFNGNLYVIANNSGVIRRYTIAGNTANGEIFSQSVATSNNDGTMCYFATIDVDFGDAPDTGSGNGPDNYNTLLASNGPRHGIIDTLYLGTQVTAEPDANQNFDATGDDIGWGVQDDGLSSPPVLAQTGGPYVLNVTVTNDTGSEAFLYGWIDFNQNGLFENFEAAPVVSVPSQTGTQTVSLTFFVPGGLPDPGHTFARLRLTTETLVDAGGAQDTRSVGPARDGEVEDYIVQVASDADLSVVKIGAPKPVRVGEILTYAIVVNNAGPAEAQDAALNDAAPAELLNVEYSLDGGAIWQPWTGSLSLGNLPPGDSRTILLRGVVAPFAAGSIVNTAEVTSSTPDPDPGNNADTDVTDVIGLADLAVNKSADAGPVRAGDILTYTVKVSNFGPGDAQDAILTDDVPAELLNVEYSVNGGASWQPWTGSLSLGTIPAGGAVEVLIRGTVAAGATGVIVNTARVDSSTPDPDPDNNEDTAVTPIETSADLAVTKTGTPSPVLNGQQLLYGITVTNNGPDAAVNAVLTDTAPAELLNVEYSLDGGTTWLPWTGSLALGDLAPNASREIFLRGTVSGPANGIIENTATVSSDTPDPIPENNTATEITPVGSSADLSVQKTASPIPVVAGETITYTVTITNAGPDAALDTVLADVLPPEVLDPEFAVQGGTDFSPWVSPYTVGTLAAGETFVVTIRGTVSPNTPNGTQLTNTAAVSSDTPDPDPENNEDTVEVPVETSADLAVTKRADTETAVPGQRIVYTITVTNFGPSEAQDVELIDAVPAALTDPEFSVDGGATWAPWVSPYPLGDLAPGESVDVLLRGVVSAGADSLTNTAVAAGATPDPNIDNNTDTEVTPVEPEEPGADLMLVKTASLSCWTRCEPLCFTLTITNLGEAAAENVILTDRVSKDLCDVRYSLDRGRTWNAWNGTVGLGAIAPGNTAAVLLRGVVSGCASGLITNVARVTTATAETDLSNNVSAVNVPPCARCRCAAGYCLLRKTIGKC